MSLTPLRAGEVIVTSEQRKAVEDTIRKLVASSIAAQNKGDIQSIRGYYAPSALSIQSGRILRDIDAMFTEYDSFLKTTPPKVKANVERVDVLAPNAAVVTTTTETSIDSAGKKLKWGHAYTGVWQNHGGRWQLVLEHASLVPDSTADR